MTADESIKVAGLERAELENKDARSLVEQSRSAWGGLVKFLENEKALLRMVIDAKSVLGAWKYLLELVNVETIDSAYHRTRRNFEKLDDERK